MATVQDIYMPKSTHTQDIYEAPIVLMVSGGSDSVALLMMALSCPLDLMDGLGKAYINKSRLHILHINHQLRGADADADERYVVSLAEKYDIDYKVVGLDVGRLAKLEFDGNVENAGRELRYAQAHKYLEELCKKADIPLEKGRIATAHTASDRAETYLMNSIRGSGMTGLASIPARRGLIVRPLLQYTHDEIKQFLLERKVQWREDATNKDTHYLRSFVRYEILPKMKTKNPQVVKSISHTCQILQEENEYLDRISQKEFENLLVSSKNHVIALDMKGLAQTDLVIGRRIIRKAISKISPEARIESSHIDSALEIVATRSGSCSICEGIDVRAVYGQLFIRRQKDKVEVEEFLSVPGCVKLADGKTIEARLVPLEAGCDPRKMAVEYYRRYGKNSILIDGAYLGYDSEVLGSLDTANILKDCFKVTNPYPAQTIQPFGMGGRSKKVVDLLGDEKIPAADRHDILVIESNITHEVVWVVGIRMAEAVRCRKDTKVLIELKVQ